MSVGKTVLYVEALYCIVVQCVTQRIGFGVKLDGYL